MATDEYGHIRAQFPPQFGEFIHTSMQAPQGIEGQQGARRIRTAAAQAAAAGQSFIQRDMRASSSRLRAVGAKLVCGAIDQVVLGRECVDYLRT